MRDVSTSARTHVIPRPDVQALHAIAVIQSLIEEGMRAWRMDATYSEVPVRGLVIELIESCEDGLVE